MIRPFMPVMNGLNLNVMTAITIGCSGVKLFAFVHYSTNEIHYDENNQEKEFFYALFIIARCRIPQFCQNFLQ